MVIVRNGTKCGDLFDKHLRLLGVVIGTRLFLEQKLNSTKNNELLVRNYIRRTRLLRVFDKPIINFFLSVK